MAFDYNKISLADLKKVMASIINISPEQEGVKEILAAIRGMTKPQLIGHIKDAKVPEKLLQGAYLLEVDQPRRMAKKAKPALKAKPAPKVKKATKGKLGSLLPKPRAFGPTPRPAPTPKTKKIPTPKAIKTPVKQWNPLQLRLLKLLGGPEGGPGGLTISEGAIPRISYPPSASPAFPGQERWFGPRPLLGPKGPMGDRPFPGVTPGEQGKLFDPRALGKRNPYTGLVGGKDWARPPLDPSMEVKGQMRFSTPRPPTPFQQPSGQQELFDPKLYGATKAPEPLVGRDYRKPLLTKVKGQKDLPFAAQKKGLTGWKKALKWGGRGLNALFLTWMLYDILRATGMLGGQREKDRTVMAGIEGLQMPQAASQRRRSFEMANLSRDVESMEQYAVLGKGKQKSVQFMDTAMSGMLDQLLANNRALRGSASLMHPTVQNQLGNLSQEGII